MAIQSISSGIYHNPLAAAVDVPVDVSQPFDQVIPDIIFAGFDGITLPISLGFSLIGVHAIGRGATAVPCAILKSEYVCGMTRSAFLMPNEIQPLTHQFQL